MRRQTAQHLSTSTPAELTPGLHDLAGSTRLWSDGTPFLMMMLQGCTWVEEITVNSSCSPGMTREQLGSR